MDYPHIHARRHGDLHPGLHLRHPGLHFITVGTERQRELGGCQTYISVHIGNLLGPLRNPARPSSRRRDDGRVAVTSWRSPITTWVVCEGRFHKLNLELV